MRLARVLTLLFCALLVPAAASARPLVGIGDHDAASFQDPAMGKIGLKTARLTLVVGLAQGPRRRRRDRRLGGGGEGSADAAADHVHPQLAPLR